MVGYAECPVNIDYLRTILGRALVSIGKIIESPISIHFQVRWFSLCDCVLGLRVRHWQYIKYT